VTSQSQKLGYSVLAYEDECGLWLKAPEFDVQICTEDFEVGLDLLEEHIIQAVSRRRKAGEKFPDRFERTVRHVGKDEYGPTLLDIERQGSDGGMD
jgi:hypothetical protein